MTTHISATRFITGYFNARVAADLDDETKILDEFITEYQNLLWVQQNEPKKMTTPKKQRLKRLETILPGYLERLKPGTDLDSLKPEAPGKPKGFRKPSKKDEERGEATDEDEVAWEEEYIEETEKYVTDAAEDIRAKSTGRAIIDLINRSFPEAPMPMTKAKSVGSWALRAVEGVLGRSGTKNVEDVIGDKLLYLVDRMNTEVVDDLGNKTNWSFKSPTKTGRPGAKNVDEALRFLIGYLKRGSVDTLRSEKMSVDDDYAELAYLKFKDLRAKLTKREKERLEKLRESIPDSDSVEPSPMNPSVSKAESYDSAFGRRDEGGELVESGESMIPDVESDPLMSDVISDPEGASKLMGAITTSLPKIKSEVKALGPAYEILWGLIFEQGLGDVLKDIKGNMNKNRDIENEMRAAISQLLGYNFVKESKNALDEYAYYLHKMEKGTLTERQTEEMSKLSKRLIKEGVDLSTIEPLEVAPQSVDEFKDFLKAFSSNSSIREQKSIPPEIMSAMTSNDPKSAEARALATFTQKFIERPANIGDARDKLLGIIQKNFTAEEIAELEDLYHVSGKEERKLREKMKAQETYEHWRNIDRRKLERAKESVSKMDLPSVAGLLVEDIDTGGLDGVPDAQKSTIRSLADKVVKLTVTPGELSLLQEKIRMFRSKIPVEYVEKLLEIPEDFSELTRLTEKGVDEDRYNRLLWLENIRPLTLPEERELADLQRKFKKREKLPTGLSPGEGYAIELSDFSKLLKLQATQDLNTILWDYFDALEDVLMAPPYSLTPVEINGIKPAASVTDSQRKMLFDRAVEFLESKGETVDIEGSKKEDEQDSKPAPAPKSPGLKDYADLKYLAEVGVFDAFSGGMYRDPTDKRTALNPPSNVKRVEIPTNALREIYETVIPNTLKIDGKVQDASFYEDIEASMSNPSLDRVISIYDKYKSKVTGASPRVKLSRVALRISGLYYGWH